MGFSTQPAFTGLPAFSARNSLLKSFSSNFVQSDFTHIRCFPQRSTPAIHRGQTRLQTLAVANDAPTKTKSNDTVEMNNDYQRVPAERIRNISIIAHIDHGKVSGAATNAS